MTLEGILSAIVIFAAIFITIAILSFVMGTRQTKVWRCENCEADLTRKQIKFGLCPYCGQKVKNFRGLHK